MARHSRLLSEQNIYHIVLKGINSNSIMNNDNDCKSFLKYFKEACVDYNVDIIAYCLMSTHIHLILKFNGNNMPEMFKSFGAKFVPKYNAFHSRTGPLFNGRFYSSPINDDCYFATVLKYVHYNPVKACLCDAPEDYKWSSYNEYIKKSDMLINRDIVENVFSEYDFRILHTIDNDDLDMFFVMNSKIYGFDNDELTELLNRNKDKDKHTMLDLLKKAELPKITIAKALNLNRRKL